MPLPGVDLHTQELQHLCGAVGLVRRPLHTELGEHLPGHPHRLNALVSSVRDQKEVIYEDDAPHTSGSE